MRPPPGAADGPSDLLAAARAGDRVAAGELVEGLRRFAVMVARRYQRRHGGLVSADELVPSGLVGVFHATARYDPDRRAGKGWTTYARAACAREIAREAAKLVRRRERERASRFGDAEATPDDRAAENPVRSAAGLVAAPAAPDPAAAADQAALADRVRAAVALLSRRQRALVEGYHGLTGPPVGLRAALRRAGLRPRAHTNVLRRELWAAEARLRELLAIAPGG